MTDVLARRDRALTPEETETLLRDRLGDGITGSTVEFATFTVHVAPGSWHAAAALCRDEELLAYDMFDNLLGVDAREEGFDVVAVLYSTSTGNRICLRTRCDGGREQPVCDSITDIYRGADWMERETWDMFGIEFVGHPGLEPRILTVENFEGWPLRKDFHLTSRVAKPWPGVKEPAELDEDGQVIERVPQIGDAPGPYDLDKAMAEQAKAINAPEVEELEDGQDEPEAASSGEGGDDADEDAPELDQETYDKLIAEGKSERIARSKAKAAFIKKQRAGGAAGTDDKAAASAKEDAPELDQETYDKLIAEGKSERIARSKAKAALIKKQRAAEAGGADDASAGSTDDPPSGDEAGGEEAGGEEAGGDDPAAAAAAKADERRKAQAEARAKKAAERAAADGDAAEDGDADETGDEADQEGDA